MTMDVSYLRSPCHIYWVMSSSKCEGSCPGAWHIHPEVRWYNTPGWSVIQLQEFTGVMGRNRIVEWHISQDYQVEESSSEVGRMWHRQLSDMQVIGSQLKKAWAGQETFRERCINPDNQVEKAWEKLGGCDTNSQVMCQLLVPSWRKLKQGGRVGRESLRTMSSISWFLSDRLEVKDLWY